MNTMGKRRFIFKLCCTISVLFHCLSMPKSAAGGTFVTKWHPDVDGNKRTGDNPNSRQYTNTNDVEQTHSEYKARNTFNHRLYKRNVKQNEENDVPNDQILHDQTRDVKQRQSVNPQTLSNVTKSSTQEAIKSCQHILGCSNVIPITQNSSEADVIYSWTTEACGSGMFCARQSSSTMYCIRRGVLCDRCFCSHCEVYDNCCPDYVKSGVAETLADRVDCKQYPLKFVNMSPPRGLKMVARCPNGTDPDLIQRCEKLVSTQISSVTPVYDKKLNVNYQNIYCAECNNENDTISWDIEYAHTWYFPLSIAVFGFQYEIATGSEFSDIYFNPPIGARPSYCTFNQTVISKCNITGKWDLFDELHFDLCNYYAHHVTVQDTPGLELGQKVYKNVFCALCNGEQFNASSEGKCTPDAAVDDHKIQPSIFSFTFTKNLKDTTAFRLSEWKNHTLIVCGSNYVYDTSRKKCQPVKCPGSYYNYETTCLPLFNSARGVPYYAKIFVHFNHALDDVHASSILTGIANPFNTFGSSSAYWRLSYELYTLPTGEHFGMKANLFFISRHDDNDQTYIERLILSIINSYWVFLSGTQANLLPTVNEVFFLRGYSYENFSLVTSHTMEYTFPNYVAPEKYLSGVDSFIRVNTLLGCRQILSYNRGEYILDDVIEQAHVLSSGKLLNQKQFFIDKHMNLLTCTHYLGSYTFSYLGSGNIIPLNLNSTLRDRAISWTAEVCGAKYLCFPTSGPDATTWNKAKCRECRCEKCEEFGDCCPDYYANKLTYQYNIFILTACIDFPFKYINIPKPDNIRVVSKCPYDTKIKNERLYLQCMNTIDMTPITDNSTDTVYRSAYCADCNGVNMSDRIEWETEIACQWQAKHAKLVTSPNRIKDGMDYEGCDAIARPPTNSYLRFCDVKEYDIISLCNNSSNNEHTTETLCLSYYHPVELDSKIYWNIFCAICNGYVIPSSNKIRYIPSTERHTASIISQPYTVDVRYLDPSGNTTHSRTSEMVQCSETHVFDPTIDECREFACPASRLRYNHSCVSMFNSARGVPYRFKLYANIPRELGEVEHNSINVVNTFVSDTLKKLPVAEYWRIDGYTITKDVGGSKHDVGLEVQFYYMASGVNVSAAIVEGALVEVITTTTFKYGTVNVKPTNYLLFEHSGTKQYFRWFHTHNQKVQPFWLTKNDRFIEVNILLGCKRSISYTNGTIAITGNRARILGTGESSNEFALDRNGLHVCTGYESVYYFKTYTKTSDSNVISSTTLRTSLATQLSVICNVIISSIIVVQTMLCY